MLGPRPCCALGPPSLSCWVAAAQQLKPVELPEQLFEQSAWTTTTGQGSAAYTVHLDLWVSRLPTARCPAATCGRVLVLGAPVNVEHRACACASGSMHASSSMHALKPSWLIGGRVAVHMAVQDTDGGADPGVGLVRDLAYHGSR